MDNYPYGYVKSNFVVTSKCFITIKDSCNNCKLIELYPISPLVPGPIYWYPFVGQHNFSQTNLLVNDFPICATDFGIPIYENTNCEGISVLKVKYVSFGPNLNISPNPSAGNFNLQNLDANISYNIAVYDVSGKQLYNNYINNKKEVLLDLNYLQNGLYFLHVNNSAYKIIIAK